MTRRPGDLYVDVVALDAGQLDLHDVGVVGLFHVGDRREGVAEEDGELAERVEVAEQLVVEALQLIEGIPPGDS